MQTIGTSESEIHDDLGYPLTHCETLGPQNFASSTKCVWLQLMFALPAHTSPKPKVHHIGMTCRQGLLWHCFSCTTLPQQA